MEKYSLLQNIFLELTLAAPIGPVNLEIIRRGLRSGFRQAFFTGAGAISADATYFVLIIFGMTTFLTILHIKLFLGIAESAVLIYLGIISARVFFRRPVNSGHHRRQLFKNSFATGYVMAITSPMTIAWWTGVFGALFAAQPATVTNLSAFLSCLFILFGCFLWVFCLALALHYGKKYITEKTTGFISLIAGIFLTGFGLYFMYRTVFQPIG